MTHFPFHDFTADDVEAAERDLAALMETLDAETDPAFRAMYADWIDLDAGFLAEMREAVYPPLPFPVVVPSMPWRLHP
jgi:hypothetical protein